MDEGEPTADVLAASLPARFRNLSVINFRGPVSCLLPGHGTILEEKAIPVLPKEHEMSVVIKTQYTHSVHSMAHYSDAGVDFFVENPHSVFSFLKWEYIGRVGWYMRDGVVDEHTGYIITTNKTPTMPNLGQVHVWSLRDASRFFEAYAEIVLTYCDKERDEAEWRAKIEVEQAANRVELLPE